VRPPDAREGAAIGGGKAVISSNVKVASAGASLPGVIAAYGGGVEERQAFPVIDLARGLVGA
jgi:hypothetical protein